MWPFRVFGISAIALSAFCLALMRANQFAAAHGGHDLSPLTVPALLLIVVGLGLCFRQKWAAVIFIAACASTAAWTGIGALFSVPMPWLVLNEALSILQALMCVPMIQHWAQLGGKAREKREMQPP